MSDNGTTDARSGEFVQSLERGLAVIRAFSAERTSLTLSDVARETGLSRAAARRFLHTLVELGYVGTDGRSFYLRPRMLDLGHAYLSSLGLPEVAQPHLRDLSEALGESSSVAVLDSQEIVYVARVAVSRIMSVAIGVGTRFPAFATSMGRAIVACGSPERREAFLRDFRPITFTSHTITDAAGLSTALDTVRAQGWALVDEELEEGLRSVAAPIRDSSGEVVAAVNVSAPARRTDSDRIVSEIVPPLLEAAQRIQDDLLRVGTRIR